MPKMFKKSFLHISFTLAFSIENLIWYAWIIPNKLYIVVYCRLPLIIPTLCEWELDRGYLSCIASGYVIKFTHEIYKKINRKKQLVRRPKPRELKQKVLSSTFCLFLPEHRLNVAPLQREPGAEITMGAKGGRGEIMKSCGNLRRYWQTHSAFTNLWRSHEKRENNNTIIIYLFLVLFFITFSANSAKY